MIIIGNYCIS